MSGTVAGAVIAVIGLLVLILAGPVIGGTLALVIGIVLIVIGAAIAWTSYTGRTL